MMSMPYQCIRRCRNLLVAARGSSIDIFNPGDGSLRSTWKCPSVQEGNDSKPNTTSQVSEKPLNGLETQRSESSIDVALESPPPAKRRKLSAAGEEGPHQNAPSKEHEMKKDQKGNKKGNKRLEAVVSGLETPAVIALAATEDGRHVIAVTGEDKSIRVFENSVDGSGRQCLKQVSQRIMPKRPCTIAITPDDSTIISADKFGDVYSLPLLIPKTADLEPLQAATPNPEPTCAKPFVPAANNLTVHSQRNRKALENQKKQTPKPSEKPEPNFKYKLLLGHVSMLTGLALVVTPDGRNCILTADRDEHIRVSRGIPQAHIIEGFCLGHTGFISQLCIPRDRADILISGGGDDELFVWDWVRGMLVSKADLRSHVVGVMNELGGPAVEDRSTEGIKVAMSGITYLRQTGSEGVEDLVVVACEGVPAIFLFFLTTQKQLQYIRTLKVPGNVLDMATVGTNGLVLSIDTIHRPGSTTERREIAIERINPLQRFVFQGRGTILSSIEFEFARDDGGMKNVGRLANLFYNLESLRKRDGDGREEE